jgi:antitoxin component HigA of HigAB toxin-antitoxin module
MERTTAITTFAMPAVNAGKAARRPAKKYQRLLGASLPHVIETKEENEYYLKVLEGLNARSSALTPAEEMLAESLILLIEDSEERYDALQTGSRVEALLELMHAKNWNQNDLLDVFGAPSVISEARTGKRRLTLEHVRRLSEHSPSPPTCSSKRRMAYLPSCTTP